MIRSKIVSGLVFCILLVAISGCTDTSNSPLRSKDVVLNGTPTISQTGPDSWLINGSVYSRRNVHYSQVTLFIVGYDSQLNVVGQETIIVYNLTPSANFQAVLNTNGTVNNVDVRALNATPV